MADSSDKTWQLQTGQGLDAKIGQVNNQFTQVDTRLNRTDLRINRLGASAAALASLKPAQLGEDDKFALSLGVGSYKNAQAMAMGAVFKPAENVLLNVAGSFSGSKNLWRRCFLEIRQQIQTCGFNTKCGQFCGSFATATRNIGNAKRIG